MIQWRSVWRYGWCRHRDLYRVHVDGVWYVACTCGYRVPLIRRNPGDPKRPVPVKPVTVTERNVMTDQIREPVDEPQPNQGDPPPTEPEPDDEPEKPAPKPGTPKPKPEPVPR